MNRNETILEMTEDSASKSSPQESPVLADDPVAALLDFDERMTVRGTFCARPPHRASVRFGEPVLALRSPPPESEKSISQHLDAGLRA